MFNQKGKLGYLLVVVLMLFMVITGCKVAQTPESVSGDLPPADTNTPTATVDLKATAAAEQKALEDEKAQTAEAQARMTEEAIAAETSEAQAELAGRKATAAAKATEGEQARLDAAATERAKATSTPTKTPEPTATNTLVPSTGGSTGGGSTAGRIVRAPGEKSNGDHYVTVKNKTSGNVTILMDNDDFKYQFNVPDGTHKIYLRPGFYFYTIYLCGGQTSGSHQFNAKWTWTLSCK